MLRIALLIWIAVAAVAAPAQPPAVAADAATFVHVESGAVFPRVVGTQRIARTENLHGSPHDSIVDYAGDDPRESTTVYLYRAAYPDARLWFGHVSVMIGSRIPTDIFDAGGEQQVRAFGSDVPNALQRVYTTERAGPFRSTSIFVAQAGEWIVKIYASSPTLDRAALTARLAAFADAIRFPAGTRFGAVAAALPECGAPQLSGRMAAPDEHRLAAALGGGAAVMQRSREPLPDQGAGWCRVRGPQSDPYLSLLRRIDGSGGWILLIGDAGRAFTAVAPGELGLPPTAATTLAVTTPSFVRVAAVADGVPDPASVAGALASVLSGRSRGLIDFGPDGITIGGGEAPPAPPKR